MQIDPSSVTWDDSPQPQPQQQTAAKIDPSAVSWDAPEATSSNATSSPSPAADRSASAPGLGQELFRQVGLTARHGMRGLAEAAEVVTEPLRKVVTDPVALAFGAPAGKPLSQIAAGAADSLGLPRPANETERVVGDAASFMAGGAAMAGAAGRVAQAAAPGVLQKVATTMAANPALQAVSSAGAGAGSGLAREAGGNEWMQLGAGLAGGLGGRAFRWRSSAGGALRPAIERQ